MTDDYAARMEAIYARLNSEVMRPEFVYQHLQQRFASMLFTLPHLEVDLPEPYSLHTRPDMVSVKLRANGPYKVNAYDDTHIDRQDWSRDTTIEEVAYNGMLIKARALQEDKDALLEEFLAQMLGGSANVRVLRNRNEQAGLTRGSYLYRSLPHSEYRHMLSRRSVLSNFTDPSANYEHEYMFRKADSQTRRYALEDPDGLRPIIRWPIQDPILYRPAGFDAPRIVPVFAHYLPAQLEISYDGGKTFVPLDLYHQQ